MISRGMTLAMQAVRLSLLALMAAQAAGVASRAQQFSAELMRTREGSVASVGHLRVSGDRVRIESPDFPDGFFLIDGARPAAYFVRPASGVFMDAKQTSALVRLFVPVDPDNPCRQWQAMAAIAGLEELGELRCEPVTTEAIGGHETLAYRVTAATGRSLMGWVDRARRFPLRIKTEDGSFITAETIRDQAQDALLFELPRGARKFDPRALIEQIKQSDVWVGAPPPASGDARHE
ncbi:MAG TPA: hypothetical protein VMU69_26755 [Bradyrhizobium sp.]|nr:hypothetical protein [Bradyrhizobium sp.]